MTTTSSFMSTLAAPAFPAALLLRTSFVLMTSSCVLWGWPSLFQQRRGEATDGLCMPHVSLRHGAQHRCFARFARYSLNRCDAWVTVAFARIAAATMAASVSMASVAPALRASFICISIQYGHCV